MMHTLLDSPKYKSFVQDRNKALEQVNLNTQTDISRMLFEALEKITGFVSHMAIQDQMSLNHLAHLTKQLDQYVDYQFQPLANQIERRLLRMRKNTFILTYLSELEAVARATKRTKSMNSMDFSQKLQKQVGGDTILGQPWSKRLWVIFTNLKHKILRAFQMSISRDDSPKDVVDAVKNAYPKIIAYKAPRRALKPIRESDSPNPKDKKEFNFYGGLTTDEDWNLAVQAYQDTELPPTRFDNATQFDDEQGVRQYNWELEQDMTDDFVQQVRDGQVEAGNDLGVKDFVWVAIIDKKTCEVCCLPRNGKTTSEIQSMLSSGELDKEDCDATTPPAHPYCRCDVAPVASTDEVEGPDWKSFQEWLDS